MPADAYPAGGLTQKHPTAFQQLSQGHRAQVPESATKSLVRNRPHLLGHREAILSQSALRWRDWQVEGAAEIGSGKRNSERQSKARLIQLINRNYCERSWLGLLPPTRGIGVGPIHITLLGSGVYHSGVEASNADSISRLSA